MRPAVFADLNRVWTSLLLLAPLPAAYAGAACPKGAALLGSLRSAAVAQPSARLVADRLCGLDFAAQASASAVKGENDGDS